MNFSQFYEILILRDVSFYLLPGGFTLFGTCFILWNQIPDSLQTTLQSFLPSSTFVLVLILLALSYVAGHILYMIHNRLFGRWSKLKRHEIMGRFLMIDKPSDEMPAFLSQLRIGIVEALGQEINSEHILKPENLLQLYFTADKYIFIKNKDVYSTYISRLTATSRFTGVMSVSWLILALVSCTNYFAGTLQFWANSLFVFTFFLLSYWFIKQSINDQEELVWNVIQATYLLKNEASNAEIQAAKSVKETAHLIKSEIRK